MQHEITKLSIRDAEHPYTCIGVLGLANLRWFRFLQIRENWKLQGYTNVRNYVLVTTPNIWDFLSDILGIVIPRR